MANADYLNGNAEFDIKGIRGPRGYSAYELAVQKGYTGSLEEWIASLRGDIGITPAITIGQVETLDPGYEATATITGTPEHPVLNLGIPLGGIVLL